MGALYNAEDISKRFSVPVAVIREMVMQGHMPHYRIKGIEEPFFRLPEAKEWISNNLIERIKGRKLVPPQVVVLSNPAQYYPRGVPQAISTIVGLEEIRTEQLCGVYFLCLGNEVVYVGQSTNVMARFQTHCQERRNQFERIFFIRVPFCNLNEVERRFIESLQPKLNKTFREDPPKLEIEGIQPVSAYGSRAQAD